MTIRVGPCCRWQSAIPPHSLTVAALAGSGLLSRAALWHCRPFRDSKDSCEPSKFRSHLRPGMAAEPPTPSARITAARAPAASGTCTGGAAGTHERLTISNMNETGIGGWGGPLPVRPGSPANECVLQLEPYSSQAQEEAQAMTLLNFNRSCCRRPAHGRPIITRSRPGDDRRDVHRSEFLIQSARPAVSESGLCQ